MNPSQAISREGLQQTIDAEIKLLEESVRALKLRRNALSPISSLPPEVFIAIFSLLCLPAGTSSLGDGTSDYHRTRLRVSHVCHQWREIALDRPLLWAHVDFFAQRGAAKLLARAKSAPLCFEANAYAHRWNDVRFSTFRKELQARAPYICRLRTSAEPLHLQNILTGLVSPAPTLEYLSLHSHTRHPNRRARRTCPIPDTLFNGSTPRLSCLELRYCNISWKSPLLKGLKHLEIFTPSTNARPKLTVWLDALDEMPRLKTLILCSASPVAPPLPFDVERATTLPSLTRLDISGSLGDCALALAHLDLPALTSLCLSVDFARPDHGDVQFLVPYIARHAHGPQDTQPLQSVFIRSEYERTEILAWPVPDIEVEACNQPSTLLARTLPTRVALSFVSNKWLRESLGFDKRLEMLDMVLAGLPLGGLVVLAAHQLRGTSNDGDLQTQHFWLHLSPKWPLLRRVLLSHHLTRGFIEMLLEDDGGRLRPLLPSLTELVIANSSLNVGSHLPLYEALAMRVEQGVPVERLDLGMCHMYDPADGWLQSLSEVVVDVLAPDNSFEARQPIISMWEAIACGPFVDNEDDRSDSDLSDSTCWYSDDEDEYYSQ